MEDLCQAVLSENDMVLGAWKGEAKSDIMVRTTVDMLEHVRTESRSSEHGCRGHGTDGHEESYYGR